MKTYGFKHTSDSENILVTILVDWNTPEPVTMKTYMGSNTLVTVKTS